MTREEIVKELLSIARQSEDAAKATDAGTAAHEAEYNSLIDNPNRSQEHQNRAMELYAYVIRWPGEAKRQRREAEVFRAAADLLVGVAT